MLFRDLFSGHLCCLPQLSCSFWDFLRHMSFESYKTWLYLCGVEILCRHDACPLTGRLGWVLVMFTTMQPSPREGMADSVHGVLIWVG